MYVVLYFTPLLSHPAATTPYRQQQQLHYYHGKIESVFFFLHHLRLLRFTATTMLRGFLLRERLRGCEHLSLSLFSLYVCLYIYIYTNVIRSERSTRTWEGLRVPVQRGWLSISFFIAWKFRNSPREPSPIERKSRTFNSHFLPVNFHPLFSRSKTHFFSLSPYFEKREKFTWPVYFSIIFYMEKGEFCMLSICIHAKVGRILVWLFIAREDRKPIVLWLSWIHDFGGENERERGKERTWLFSKARKTPKEAPKSISCQFPVASRYDPSLTMHLLSAINDFSHEQSTDLP